MRHETLRERAERQRGSSTADRFEVVHSATVTHGPLPQNVESAAELPDDKGWWGFSFRDVPARPTAETALATLADCRIAWYRDAAKADDFYPAIVTGDERALDLREIRFRRPHAAALRRSAPVELDRATWIVERVFHNHSHWLSAHLPKLALLQQLDALDAVVLPRQRPEAVDASLRFLGLDPDAFGTFDEDRPLEVGELTIVACDRFRPEMLRLVQAAASRVGTANSGRRIYISRSQAARRRLANEEQIWPLLADAGFERVHAEELTFDEQVRLMQEAAVLCGPHGAGLTNMVFCPPGTDVVEIADLSFPNPNFYALATAVGHRYWLVEGTGIGSGQPLDRDLKLDPSRLRQLLAGLDR